MRFLFVDRITSHTEATISGQKAFAESDPLQYRGTAEQVQIAPGVISEAIGQLASWHCIAKNGFSARPVFLFSDRIIVNGPVYPGSVVDIFAKIERQEERTFVFSGSASVDGRLVHTITSCSGYFMPLGDLEDPAVTESRFNALTDDGLKLEDDGRGFDFDTLIDTVVEQVPGQSITARKTMDGTEPFFRDHFPRFPVTPIVMINEMIGRTVGRLVLPGSNKMLIAKEVSGIKIKSFVRPHDTIDITAKIVEPTEDPNSVTVMAELKKDNKSILRGKYEFRLQ